MIDPEASHANMLDKQQLGTLGEGAGCTDAPVQLEMEMITSGNDALDKVSIFNSIHCYTAVRLLGCLCAIWHGYAIEDVALNLLCTVCGTDARCNCT